jgi:hypothetical protein
MTTVYLSAGPVPHPMRVTIMQPPPLSSRAPESGYSFAVPDTWDRSEFDPDTAPWGDLWYKNTGWMSPPWESGGPVISDGMIVRVPMRRHRVSGGMGPVEVGSAQGRDPEWCCSWWNVLCDADDCADDDREAAEEWIERTGRPGVVAPPDEARERVRDLYPETDGPTSVPCASTHQQTGTNPDGSPICEPKPRRSKRTKPPVRKPVTPLNGGGTLPNGTGPEFGMAQPTHLRRYAAAYGLGALALIGFAAWRLTK